MDLLQFGIVLKAVDMMSGVFSSATSKSKASLSGLESSMESLSGKLTKLGTQSLATGSIITGAMQKPVEAFASAEDAATGLKVAMLGAGGELDSRFGKINKLATELGDKLPGTTADFQNMMTALVKQGISYDAILGGVGKASAYLGVMLKKPPEQAAEFVAKLQDATGTAEKDMMGLMDTIQRATYLGVNDSNMLQFFTKMTPAMDTMKRKGADAAKEMAPFAVMFDQAGMAGEAAGNAMRKVVQLGMDVKKVTKANKDLASHGIQLDFTDGKGEFGGMPNLMAQLDKLKGLKTTDQLKALKDIFGDDAETLQALSIMINKGADGYNDTVDRMAKQASLQSRVNEQLGTLKNLWDAATGTFTNTLAAFGETVAPELKALTEWIGEASAKITEFIQLHPDLAKVIGLVAGAVGGGLMVAGGAALAIGTVGKIGGTIGGVFGKKGKKGAGLGDALSSIGVQKVYVTNWPSGGAGSVMGDLAENIGDLPGKGKAGGAAGTAGKAGKFGKFMRGSGKWLGRAGALVSLGVGAMSAYEIVNDKSMSTKQKAVGLSTTAGETAGGIVGGMAGAKLGAVIGTMIMPGVGTAVGALIGGAAGGIIGSGAGGRFGKWVAGKFVSDDKPGKPAAKPAMNVAAPGQLVPKPAPAAVPLNPRASASAPAAAATGQAVALTYSPTLTIQGDPIPGTAEKFQKLLVEHRDLLAKMVDQAVSAKARTAY